MKTLEEVKIFVEDLEETMLRLHVQLRAWEEQYDQFKKIPSKFSKGRKDYEEIKQHYTYYQGKFYAYFHTLLKLGSTVPILISNLRGVHMTSSVVWEEKAHYTERYGHFKTDQYLRQIKTEK
jgi:methionine synthase II (cobalamin-independent)